MIRAFASTGRILPVALLAAAAACSHRATAAPADAGIAAAGDGAARPAGRRRRARRGPRNAVASAHVVPANSGTSGIDPRGVDPGAANADDLALAGDEDDDVTGPIERPRITENGPMLPDDVGRPGAVSFDMRGSDPSGPMGLDPSQIAEGMRPLMSRLTTCAAATGAHGHVAVRIRVASSGAPTAAHVSGPGPAEFLTCVRRVIASARFDHFNGPDTLASWGFDVSQ